MRKGISSIWHEKGAILQALFLTSIILHCLFADPELHLERISRISIDQASIEGVDVGKRIQLFYGAILLGGLLFLLLFHAFSLLRRRSGASQEAWRVSGFFALIGIGIIGAELVYGPTSSKPLSLTLLFFFLSLSLPFWEKQTPRLKRSIRDRRVLYPLAGGSLLALTLLSLPQGTIEGSEAGLYYGSILLLIAAITLLAAARPDRERMILRFGRIRSRLLGLRERALQVLFLSAALTHYLFKDPRVQVWEKGGDAGWDIGWCLSIIGVATCSILLFSIILSWLEKKAKSSEKTFRIPTLIALTGLLMLLGDFYLEGRTRTSIDLTLLLFFLAYLPLCFHRWPQRKLLSLSHPFIPLLLCCTFILFAACLFGTGVPKESPLLEKGLLWLGTGLLLAAFLQGSSRLLGIPLRKLFHFLSPLALLPLILFLSVEGSFLAVQRFGIELSPGHAFLLLSVPSLGIGFLKLRGKQERSALKMLERIYGPSALLAFLLLAFYQPIVEPPSGFFEPANPANSQLKIFGEGAIPLVDFISSHLLSEEIYGSIYHGLFGFQEGSVGFFSFRILNELLFYGLLFVLLRQVLASYFFAFLLILSFPFLPFFFVRLLFPAVIAFFLLRKLLSDQKPRRVYFLLLALFLLLLWRLDTGAASLIASTAFLPLALYGEDKRFQAGSFFQGLSYFGLSILPLIGGLLLFRSPAQLMEAVANSYRYFSATQAHGSAQLVPQGVHALPFYLYHVFIPAFSLLAILYIVRSLRTRREGASYHDRSILHASLFFYLLQLANFHRGLVRHGFMEYTELFLASSFFLATTLLLFSFRTPQDPYWRYIRFICTAVLILLPLKHFPFYKEQAPLERALKDPALSKGIEWKGKAKRVQADRSFREKNYDDIKAFLDRNLRADQTFLDFSNSPMLYYYTGRRIPSFFCPSLQNSIDEKLQWKHLDRVDPSEVPVVIRSNAPPSWWDRTDGVPNAMRYFWIAEFVHAHYEAFGILDGHSIWVRKGFDPIGEPRAADTINTKPRTHENGVSGASLNGFFEKREWNGLKLLAQKRVQQNDDPPHRFDIPLKVERTDRLWLRTELDGSEEAVLDIRIIGEKGLIGREKLRYTPNKKMQLIRISEHALWHHGSPTHLKILTEGKLELRKLGFYRDERYVLN